MLFMQNILVPLGVFAMIVLIIWISYKLRVRNREMINKERMALIEKGVYDFPREKPRINLHKYLLWGFILIGFGIALIIGSFIESDEDMIIGGLVFLFPGLGILLFYKIQSKKEKEKKEEISANSEAANISE